MDYISESSQSGNFARMAVTVNLNKPLVSGFIIDECIQKVKYDDLPVICYACGCFGHVIANCQFSHGDLEVHEGNNH